jgi:hypothetical protein
MDFDSRMSTVYMHVDELRQEAEEYRMAKLAQAGRQSFADRMFVRLGDVLIAFGANLKQRAERRMNQVIAQGLPSTQRMQL